MVTDNDHQKTNSLNNILNGIICRHKHSLVGSGRVDCLVTLGTQAKNNKKTEEKILQAKWRHYTAKTTI